MFRQDGGMQLTLRDTRLLCVCVCMYICIYIYIYIYICIYIYIYRLVRSSGIECVYIYTHALYIYIYACESLYIYIIYIHTYICLRKSSKSGRHSRVWDQDSGCHAVCISVHELSVVTKGNLPLMLRGIIYIYIYIYIYIIHM
jgi:hypothetical protein